MSQLLTLPSVNVANNNSADKATKPVVKANESERFSSEFDRQVTESQRQEKEKVTKPDNQPEAKQTAKTEKAEKSESKDGKKLPPEASDTEVEGEPTLKVVDESNPLTIISVAPLTDVKDAKKTPDLIILDKALSQTQDTETDAAKTLLAMPAKTNFSESPAAAIRADILQAIQKQAGSGESVATENFKSMMQNAAKMPQQTNTVVSAEVIASVRQLEPQVESNITSKLSQPLVFTTTPTNSATPVIGASNVASPTLTLDIQPQLNNAAWSKVMSSRVVWMAREGVQQAELRLNPAHLGPVEVRLSMQNDQTSVTFIASNAAARDALEQALPRLRDSFTENGLALNHAEVSHQQQSSHDSKQDDQLSDGQQTAKVMVELDDIEGETAHLSADLMDNSVGVSLFA